MWLLQQIEKNDKELQASLTNINIVMSNIGAAIQQSVHSLRQMLAPQSQQAFGTPMYSPLIASPPPFLNNHSVIYQSSHFPQPNFQVSSQTLGERSGWQHKTKRKNVTEREKVVENESTMI